MMRPSENIQRKRVRVAFRAFVSPSLGEDG